jgi:hypothetical protein
MQRTFIVHHDSNHFWEVCTDEQGNPYEQAMLFSELDVMANGFKWGMSVKGTNQRKYHAKSVMTNSIYAMLDYVKDELAKDFNAIVVCHTPDVRVEFYQG